MEGTPLRVSPDLPVELVTLLPAKGIKRKQTINQPTNTITISLQVYIASY